MMNRIFKSRRGQAMTEYIIIVAIIALAALAVFGLFGDRIRAMLGGAVVELGGDEADVSAATEVGSQDYLKSLDETGAR